jgi:hypothetical protein
MSLLIQVQGSGWASDSDRGLPVGSERHSARSGGTPIVYIVGHTHGRGWCPLNSPPNGTRVQYSHRLGQARLPLTGRQHAPRLHRQVRWQGRGHCGTGHSDSVHIPTMRKVLRQCEVPKDHRQGRGWHPSACACRRVHSSDRFS